MALAVSSFLTFKVGKDTTFSFRDVDAFFSINDTSSYNYTSSGLVSVADAATETLSLGEIVTGGVLFVESSRAVKLLLSSSGSADQVVPIAANGGFFLKGAFTGIKVQNASGGAALVRYSAVGT